MRRVLFSFSPFSLVSGVFPELVVMLVLCDGSCWECRSGGRMGAEHLMGLIAISL